MIDFAEKNVISSCKIARNLKMKKREDLSIFEF